VSVAACGLIGRIGHAQGFAPHRREHVHTVSSVETFGLFCDGN
jgi:hypothetical protein